VLPALLADRVFTAKVSPLLTVVVAEVVSIPFLTKVAFPPVTVAVLTHIEQI
jgi:hypothetical protein